MPDLRGKGMVVGVSTNVLTDGRVGPRIEKSEKGYMTEQDKKQALSQKRKAHRATACDTCGHPLAAHHCLGKCKSKNCRCYQFLSVSTRKSREAASSAGSTRAGARA
jgi:hypothetical protein